MRWAGHEKLSETLICPECGYDLRGTPTGPRCPECAFEFDKSTIIWRGRWLRILGGPGFFALIPNLLLPFLFAPRNQGIRIPPMAFWEQYGLRMFSGVVWIGFSVFVFFAAKKPVYIATCNRGILLRNLFSRAWIPWSDFWSCTVGWGYVHISRRNRDCETSRVWLCKQDSISLVELTQARGRLHEGQTPA